MLDFPKVTIEEFTEKARELGFTEQEINEMIAEDKKEGEVEDKIFGRNPGTSFLESLAIRYAGMLAMICN